MKSNNVLMVGTDTSTMGGIASVINDYIEYGIFDRLSIDYHPTHKDGSKREKAVFFLKQLVLFNIKVFKYKIIHLHTSHGWSYRRLFLILLISKLLKKKVILHIHGSQFDLYYDNTNKIERFFIRQGLKYSDYVIALSDTWKEKIMTIERTSNVVVILNTVNTEKYAVSDRNIHKPLSVLFLGRLGERKGIYDILKAISLLDYEQYFFILAGDGELEKVKKIISEEKLNKYVSVPGWVQGDQKIKLLQNADIYILPSYNEGLPIGILEAISSGLPVIASSIGGIPEAVIDGVNGYLIEPGDFKSLANKLQELYKDQQKLKDFGYTSEKIALEKFSMNRAEKQLEIIYIKLES